MKIYIIEDDEVISNALKIELETWNYQVFICQNFSDPLKEINDYEPNLILLDIFLPYNNGYYLCNQIRRVSKVPIIFISSKSEKMDILLALTQGGDDYLVKPIDLNITIAKINALLRRSYDYIHEFNFLTFNNINLYYERNIISYNGQEIELSKTENIIMSYLFKNKDTISDKNMLVEYLWQDASFIDENTLFVNINRLRQKLNTIGLEKLILTKKGQGYYLNKDIGK